MCAKRKDPIGFRLDVCRAGQAKLERLFSRPGTCYGDLRRQKLIAERAVSGLDGITVNTAAREDATLLLSDDDWIDQYLKRRSLEERYPEHADCDPSFTGGALEKNNEGTKTQRQQKQNDRANNAKQHSRFIRDEDGRLVPRSRQSIRKT